MAIAFGMYERTPHDVFHNSVVIVDKTGAVVPWRTPEGRSLPAYRKLSLPANWVGGVDIDEKYWSSPGQSPAVVDLFGTRIACAICYDRSFPEYWAVARALGAEVVLAIVSSLGTREDLFLAELQTHATESQSWIVAANRAGVEKLGDATVDSFGLSAVLRPNGEIVQHAPAHQAGVTFRSRIDLDEVRTTRSGFPLGRDKRPDVLTLLANLATGTVAVPAVPAHGRAS